MKLNRTSICIDEDSRRILHERAAAHGLSLSAYLRVLARQPDNPINKSGLIPATERTSRRRDLRDALPLRHLALRALRSELTGLRLNLGCGFDIRPEYLNVDFTKENGADLAMDLEKTPWPWANDSMEEVLALNLLEHINRMDAVWREIHRVLRVGGRVDIEVVNGDSHDPFHHSLWNRSSIRHLTNGYATKASPKYAFRLVEGPHYRHIPSGFPWWHFKMYLGITLPAVWPMIRHIRFTLEKVC